MIKEKITMAKKDIGQKMKTALTIALLMILIPLAFAETQIEEGEKGINNIEAEVYEDFAIISWTTTEPTNSVVQYGISSLGYIEKDDVETEEHHVTLSKLSSGTQYNYVVGFTNEAGNDITHPGDTTMKFTTLEANESSEDNVNEKNDSNTEISLTINQPATPTNQKTVTISGTATPGATIRAYINPSSGNWYPETITWTNGKKMSYFEAGSDGNYSGTITLIEGKNDITLVAMNKYYKKATQTATVEVDSVGPTLKWVDTQISKGTMWISGFVSANSTLTIEGNGTSQNVAVSSFTSSNDSALSAFGVDANIWNKISYFNQSLSLPEGKYEITLTAKDTMGNNISISREILFDKTPPQITLDRTDLGTQHFSIVDIKGSVSEKATVHVRNYGTKNCFEEEETTSCVKSEDCASSYCGSDGYCIKKEYASYTQGSLLGTLFLFDSEQEADTSFDFKVGLKSQRDTSRNGTSNTAATNNICIRAIDEAGNKAQISVAVVYEPGSKYWEARNVESMPNEIYATWLRAKALDGSLTFNLEYHGPNPEKITNMDVEVISEESYDTSGNLAYSVASSGVEAFPDSTASNPYSKVTVYAPYTIDQWTGDSSILPSKKVGDLNTTYVTFKWKAQINYNMNGAKQTETVFFESVTDVEKPLDHTKWLTPEMIDSLLHLINDTLDITKTAREITDEATKYTMLGCFASTAVNFVSGGNNDNIVKTTYALCDRIMCPKTPVSSKTLAKRSFDVKRGDGQIDSMTFKLADGVEQEYNVIECQSGSKDDREKANSNKENLQEVYGDSQYVSRGVSDMRDCSSCAYYLAPVLSAETALEYDDDNTILGQGLKTETRTLTKGKCYETSPVDALCGDKSSDKDNLCSSKEAQESLVNDKDLRTKTFSGLQDQGIIYNPNKPYYHQFSCVVNIGSAPGDPVIDNINPYESIMESTVCGCFPAMSNQLGQIERILTGAKKCLEQAKIGNVEGSYCERLLSQYVCDLAIYVIKKIWKIMDSTADYEVNTRTGKDAQIVQAGSIVESISNAKEKMGDRYGDVLESALGLNAQGVAHKICMSAFSGDWDDIEGAFTDILDSAPVEPVIGPALPESRVYGYNPLNGELTIAYMYTLGIMSGGQAIDYTMTLYCDRAYEEVPGTYCPSVVKSLEVERGRVEADGSIETTEVEYSKDPYWYNKLVLHVDYAMQGETKSKDFTFGIARKGDLVAQCSASLYSSPGYGFTCGTLTPDNSDIVELEKVSMTPESSEIFYHPGMPIRAKLLLRNVGRDDNKDFYIKYRVTDQAGNELSIAKLSDSVRVKPEDIFGENGQKEEAYYILTIPTSESQAESHDYYTQTMSIKKDTLASNPPAISNVESANYALVFDISNVKSGSLKITAGSKDLALSKNGETLYYYDDKSYDYLSATSNSITFKNDITFKFQVEKSVSSNNIVAKLKICKVTDGSLTTECSNEITTINIDTHDSATGSIWKSQTYKIGVVLLGEDGSSVMPGTTSSSAKTNIIDEASMTKYAEFKMETKKSTANECKKAPMIEIVKPYVPSDESKYICDGQEQSVWITLWDDCEFDDQFGTDRTVTINAIVNDVTTNVATFKNAQLKEHVKSNEGALSPKISWSPSFGTKDELTLKATVTWKTDEGGSNKDSVKTDSVDLLKEKTTSICSSTTSSSSSSASSDSSKIEDTKTKCWDGINIGECVSSESCTSDADKISNSVLKEEGEYKKCSEGQVCCTTS